MESELGTDPDLLWPLLLSQIVYDEIGKGNTGFDNVYQIFSEHPLKPATSPVLDSAQAAEDTYKKLLSDHQISNPDLRMQANLLAEIYYVKFRENLTAQINNDSNEFLKAYKQYEQDTNVPNEERIAEE